jgi:hypothetical protein
LFEKGVEFLFTSNGHFGEIENQSQIITHEVLFTYPPLLKRKTRLHEDGNGWMQSETMS